MGAKTTPALEIEEELGLAIATLPLQEVDFSGEVDGLVADITCLQTFANSLDRPVEAIYKFPLPAEATVLRVAMQIGTKTVVAELKKKEEAQKDYDDAVSAGHHGALLTQKRPNIFEMSVGGIEPGETITVRLRFMLPVPWQGSGGRLTLPLVVAPRFISASASGQPAIDGESTTDNLNPTRAGEVSYTAGIHLEITPGFPATFGSPSHDLIVDATEVAAGATHTVALAGLRPDRDVVLTYVTRAEQPHVAASTADFLTTEGITERFALIQVTPQLGTGTRPRDVVFVLDRSGSMRGAMIEGLKLVVKETLDRLAKSDSETSVGIVQYNNTTDVLVPVSPVGPNHYAAVESITALGGTETGHALNTAMRLFDQENSERERSIILVTDGQTESRTFQAVPGVRIYSIGIGTAINDEYITQVAKQTGGVTETMTPGEDFAGIASRFAGLSSGPVVRQLEIQNLAEANVVGLADLFAARPTTIAIRFTAEPPKSITLTGRQITGERWQITVDLTSAATTSQLPIFHWAKEHLLKLSGDANGQVAASLKYGVLCGRTAFVAVSLKEVAGAAPERIEVPVLLPHGWDAGAFATGHTLAAGIHVRGGGVRGGSSAKRLRGGAPSATGRTLGTSAFGGGGGSSHYGLESLGVKTLGGGATRGFSPSADLDYLAGRSLGGSPEPPLSGPNDTLDDTLMGDTLDRYIPATPPSHSRPVNAARQTDTLLDQFERFLKLNATGTRPSVQHWENLLRDLKGTDLSTWSELERARLYQILVALRYFNWRTTIPALVKVRPSDADAYRVWAKAQAELGVTVK